MTPARTHRLLTPLLATLTVAVLTASCTSQPAADVTTTTTVSPTAAAAPAAPSSTAVSSSAPDTAAAAAREEAARRAAALRASQELARSRALALSRSRAVLASRELAASRARKLAASRALLASRAELARRKALAAIDPLTGGRNTGNPVVAVKLDNTSAGRPQFGIQAADWVVVEQVEGGLTRIIALFHSRIPAEVGPVRSVRSTDTEFLPMFGKPLLVYSGGAGGPLARLAASRVIDTSGLGGTFRSSAKPAPYNLHASLPSIIAAQRARQGGAPWTVQRPGPQFAEVTDAFRRYPVVTSVDVVMSAGRTSFAWSGARDAYRVQPAGSGGFAADGTPLYADNVLVQRISDTPDGTVDTNGQPSLLSRTVGRGTFQLFRNGRLITGTWSRPSVGAPTRYYDSRGGIATFSPGKTWLMLVPQDGAVSWAR